MSKKIYLASPYGFSEAGRLFLATTLKPIIIGEGYEVIDPWELTSNEEIEKVRNLVEDGRGYKALKERELHDTIATRNIEAIKDSRGVLAVLDGTDVDSGVSGEIGFAYGLDKRIIGYRGDFRTMSEHPSLRVNLQIEGFIRKSSGIIICTYEDIPKALHRVFGSSL
jgi:nucleoside 2-deoxyribosyltransferase